MGQRIALHMPTSTSTPSVKLPQRLAKQAAPTTIPSIVHEVLRSPGQPLEPVTRAFFESHFGHHFSQVRVHGDTKAAESERVVDALGLSHGDESGSVGGHTWMAIR